MNATIAAAIEKQAAITSEVAGNIGQATLGVQDANDQVTQTAQLSQHIARESAQVNLSLTEISRAGAYVLSAATTLTDLAHTLQTMIDRFTVR